MPTIGGVGTAADLQPGEGVSLLGANDFSGSLFGTWVYPTPGTVKIRARYYNYSRFDVKSDWVEVQVGEQASKWDWITAPFSPLFR